MSSPHLLQYPSCFLQLTLFDEAVWSLGKESSSNEHQYRGHHGQSKGQSPPPRMQLLREVVDNVSDQDSGDGGKLEQLVNCAADPGRCNLGEIKWDRLIPEADSKSEENAAGDQHEDVDGACVDGTTEEEADGAGHDARPSSVPSSHEGGSEGGDERRKVEGRGEERQHLVVVLAVVAFVAMRLLPSVHGGEELLQEIIHGCHST